jgi:hypothetical protein
MRIVLALLVMVALMGVASGSNIYTGYLGPGMVPVLNAAPEMPELTGAQVYLAQGDPAWILEPSSGGTCWLFPFNEVGEYYDIPASTNGNETFCGITAEQSANMKEGRYTMVYVYPAIVNGKPFKDVSWIDNRLVSTFSHIKPIDESGKQGPMVMTDLYAMVKANNLNNIVNNTIDIQAPFLHVTELRQTAENLYTVKGTTNFAEGTPLIIKIDEDRYYSQHNTSFMYKSTVSRPYNKITGTFKCDMLMPIQEMPPGWHNLTIYSKELITEVRFKVDEHEWGPAPTPTEYVKYLSNGDLTPIYINTTVIVNQTQYIDRWLTATPTPAITDALGGNVEYPYKTGEQIPGWIALLATIGIAGLVLVRDWKWKK